jgi:hypothetical protein
MPASYVCRFSGQHAALPRCRSAAMIMLQSAVRCTGLFRVRDAVMNAVMMCRRCHRHGRALCARQLRLAVSGGAVEWRGRRAGPGPARHARLRLPIYGASMAMSRDISGFAYAGYQKLVPVDVNSVTVAMVWCPVHMFEVVHVCARI